MIFFFDLQVRQATQLRFGEKGRLRRPLRSSLTGLKGHEMSWFGGRNPCGAHEISRFGARKASRSMQKSMKVHEIEAFKEPMLLLPKAAVERRCDEGRLSLLGYFAAWSSRNLQFLKANSIEKRSISCRKPHETSKNASKRL